jgi:hypothetical protein
MVVDTCRGPGQRGALSRNETKRAALRLGRLYFWPSHELLGSYTAIPDRERITLGTYR